MELKMDKLEILKKLVGDNIQLVDQAGIPVSMGRTKNEIVWVPKLLDLVRLLVELEKKRPFAAWRKGYRQVKAQVDFYISLVERWTDLLVEKVNEGEWLLKKQ